MVATPAIAAAIVDALAGFAGRVVFDPVLGASSGGALFRGSAADLMPLVRRASLVTPNLSEAAALTGLAVADLLGASEAARKLKADGARAVLIKGGHLPSEATDVLCDDRGEEIFRATRLRGTSPRGTGCALATAIAIHLARGRELRDAVRIAKSWLWQMIQLATTVGPERHLFD
jgi:hydroxymethylpyrimidine kinase/phosphomethylpyrimidine kinase